VCIREIGEDFIFKTADIDTLQVNELNNKDQFKWNVEEAISKKESSSSYTQFSVFSKHNQPITKFAYSTEIGKIFVEMQKLQETKRRELEENVGYVFETGFLRELPDLTTLMREVASNDHSGVKITIPYRVSIPNPRTNTMKLGLYENLSK
jgi:hypothetical protein